MEASAGNDVAVTSENRFKGVLSAFVDAPDGSGVVAILSGHVAHDQGAAVQAQQVAGSPVDLGTVTKLLLDGTNDIASAGPVSSSVGGLVLDPSPLRDPDESDVTFSAFIYTARQEAPIETVIQGIGASQTFGDGSHPGDRMSGLVATILRTGLGDSGSPVFDGRQSLIGFVVGGDSSYTYLLPARRAINALF